eukprot:364588-Chlamydomonas_euryale.AAC.23
MGEHFCSMVSLAQHLSGSPTHLHRARQCLDPWWRDACPDNDRMHLPTSSVWSKLAVNMTADRSHATVNCKMGICDVWVPRGLQGAQVPDDHLTTC